MAARRTGGARRTSQTDGFWKTVLDHVHDGVYVTDTERRIVYWNPGAERVTGFPGDRIIGTRCSDDILNHTNDAGDNLCEADCPLAKTLTDGEPREASIYLKHASGHRVPVHVRTVALRDGDNRITGAVETFSDNSRTLVAQRRASDLERAALQDPLTGVGNRHLGESRVISALSESWGLGVDTGVLMVDVDDLKAINDAWGHPIGDQALKIVADTIRLAIRETDLVCRWGGDEFLVLLPGLDARALPRVAQKLTALVRAAGLRAENARTGNAQVALAISTGATMTRPDDTPESLLKRVDALLYQSKAAGGGRASVSP